MTDRVGTTTTQVSTARQLIETLADRGYGVVSGVPCSMLKGAFTILEQLERNVSPLPISYVAAPREDSAVGVATGALVAGVKSAVFMQNSGLGYCLNVITSLNHIYDLPILLVVSWRGMDGNDAVEHDVIGRVLPALLDTAGIPHAVLNQGDVEASVTWADAIMSKEGRCAALLVTEGI